VHPSGDADRPISSSPKYLGARGRASHWAARTTALLIRRAAGAPRDPLRYKSHETSKNTPNLPNNVKKPQTDERKLHNRGVKPVFSLLTLPADAHNVAQERMKEATDNGTASRNCRTHAHGPVTVDHNRTHAPPIQKIGGFFMPRPLSEDRREERRCRELEQSR